MGNRTKNIFKGINLGAVPYMMRLGGQSFATAYANVWKGLCAPGAGGRCSQIDLAGSGGLAALIASVPAQPFFEAALGWPSSTYCTGFTNCTQALLNQSGVRTHIGAPCVSVICNYL